ncbi:MAG: phage minor head protein [Pseudomonadota bacterium]
MAVSPQPLRPLANEQAVAFWKKKVPMSPREFNQLDDKSKALGFSVGGIAKGDELATVMDAMGRAASEGMTLHEFKKQCGDIFTRRGWTGEKAWRIDNLFRTNLQTQYSAGRWAQMQATAERRPYGQYSAVNDSRTREAHAAMHGRVFPLDSPVWDEWWPTNGFR